jgi:hypothetical protein
MTTTQTEMSNPRAAAVAELFAALEELLISYHIVPATQRETCWATDADRITGEIARQLATTRARLSPSFAPAAIPTR